MFFFQAYSEDYPDLLQVILNSVAKRETCSLLPTEYGNFRETNKSQKPTILSSVAKLRTVLLLIATACTTQVVIVSGIKTSI